MRYTGGISCDTLGGGYRECYGGVTVRLDGMDVAHHSYQHQARIAGATAPFAALACNASQYLPGLLGVRFRGLLAGLPPYVLSLLRIVYYERVSS